MLNYELRPSDLKANLPSKKLQFSSSCVKMALVTLLGPDEDVGNVLVFAEEGDVEENFQGFGVGSKNDELGLASVQGLGRLIGTFAHLKAGRQAD